MNTTDNIKNLNLTDKDFKMLVDGLDALPHAGRTGEMLMDIMTSTVLAGKIGEEAKKKMDAERRKEDIKKEMLIEDAKILQGKLLMLKRYLTENRLMNDVDDVLKNHL
jgi:hypothetical protein